MKVNKFQGRTGGTYICRICGKRTRETGDGESYTQLCSSCYNMAGQENAHSDENHAGNFKHCDICKKALGSAWNVNYKF